MQLGGGGVQGSAWQFVPKLPPRLGMHCAECVPDGQTPLSGIGKHWGGAPPQHGCQQYCVGWQVCDPQAKGPSAGGGGASLEASGPSHAISSWATDHADPVHVAIEGPPLAQP